MNDITGLSEKEVNIRKKKGKYNKGTSAKTKSMGQILFANIFTLFNLVNILLATGLFMVHSYKNATFLGVVFWNIIIGVIQETRAKRIIDKLAILSAPVSKVIRDGNEYDIKPEEIVIDDICILDSGKQICADGIIIEGQCEVNESLLTGESEPILKKVGDEVLSGSFVISGKVITKVIHVGDDNYVNSITNSVKVAKKINSQIYNSAKKIVKIVSLCIAPMFVLMFCKQLFIEEVGIRKAVVSTTASVIGMIPSGLILLISMVMAISVIRLARYNCLIQDMYCTETLARVNVLCLDKTGTITEGKIKAEEIIPVTSHYGREDVDIAIGEFSKALNDNNPTFYAIKSLYNDYENKWICVNSVEFSSEKKWSMAVFQEKGTFVLGAAEFVVKDIPKHIKETISNYQSLGKRVLIFAMSEQISDDDKYPEDLKIIALIVFSDIIRSNAKKTLDFFHKQGVDIKVISGDNMLTVSNIAKEAGVRNSDACVDASELTDYEEIEEAVKKYTVFARVTPKQKLQIIKALKEDGKTVAMTGDGVNDVLALKEADCSIAMQSGSDAARNISDIVLMDSDFSSMPHVLNEGRRNINNLQRSAALFLTKTTYSIILAVIFMILPFEYPFEPIQLTLVSSLFIGVPSFVLALEKNHDIVKGNFLNNVLNIAIPAGITVVVNILSAEIFGKIIGANISERNTMALYAMAIASAVELLRLCMPLNTLRRCLVTFSCSFFIVAILCFERLFSLTIISKNMTIFAVVAFLISFLLRNIYRKKIDN